MYSKVYSGIPVGIDGMLITVEADISSGLPSFDMVGYLAASVKEARDRVRSALRNTGFILPAQRITVNLSPADIRKDGTGFDLSIAVAVLIAMQVIPDSNLFDNIIFLGELGLDGSILPVPGVLPIVHFASLKGIRTVIVPLANSAEARFIRDIEVIPVENLGNLVEMLCYMSGGGSPSDIAYSDYTGIDEISGIDDTMLGKTEAAAKSETAGQDYVDFADIRGQESAKRGMLIAAAGFHNILLTGAAGSGKSMMAKALPGILPDMDYEEKLELTKIYSIAGMLKGGTALIDRRPFRSPHYSVSEKALIGGGERPRPGEITLATGGVLFLDEFPHFKREAIEALRQPLEDKKVTVSRLRATYTFPARFMLVAARNNCPCGFYPDRTRCRCSYHEIAAYRNRISHPIMDRIDIRLEVAPLSYEDMFCKEKGTPSKVLREVVEAARERQSFRYRDEDWCFNSELPQGGIERYIDLSLSCDRLLKTAYDSMDISARGYFRLIRLTRTIADLNDREKITEDDIREAIFFRNEGREEVV